ncbi:hypothetical protein FA13DRAFT_1416247 [Coprinellus micaceus]|uniref:Uncharacterized protein n=1 Tax=Coprinellus micaceus TaxID=71717 RepID=A0A4Y7SN65_COPMI|nr:hypothetical protein FA13DRAFT_1416247 [Coprinellus micaceus]
MSVPRCYKREVVETRAASRLALIFTEATYTSIFLALSPRGPDTLPLPSPSSTLD